MIVKNFLETQSRREQCHEGKGEVENVFLYSTDDFESALHFMNYTVLPPGSSIGLHRHGRNEEMYVILEGEGLMTTNDETRRVKTGDAILNRQGWSHSLENDTDSDLRILVFEAGFKNESKEGD